MYETLYRKYSKVWNLSNCCGKLTTLLQRKDVLSKNPKALLKRYTLFIEHFSISINYESPRIDRKVETANLLKFQLG